MAIRKKLDLTAVLNALLTDTGEDNDLEYLKANGPRALPSSPTSSKWSAEAIKKQLYMQPEILFAWLKELADAVDAFAEAVDDFLAEGTANAAQYDADGNDIAETYITIADAVSKAGTETITGAKTFTANVALGSSGSDNSKAIDIYFTTNLRGPVKSNTILPGNTGFSLGGSGYGERWNTAYVQNLNILGKIIYYSSYELSLPLVTGTLTTTSHVADEINKIKDGVYTAKKAEKDGNGNVITDTYETKVAATAKVALSNLRSILGLASTSEQGLMSAEDKSHLNALYALLGAEADSDTVVNTINEVLAIFSQYPEGVTLANALAAKVAFSDVINNLTSNEISKPLSAYQGKVLDGRLTEVEEDYISQDNALAIGLIQISEIDSVPSELQFDANGDVSNANWTGEISIEYNNSAMTITSSDVPATLTFNTANDFNNLITNANWTGELTFTY